MPCSVVPTVIEYRIRDIEMSHELREIRLRRLHNEMRVFIHQHIGMESDRVEKRAVRFWTGSRRTELFLKSLEIFRSC